MRASIASLLGSGRLVLIELQRHAQSLAVHRYFFPSFLFPYCRSDEINVRRGLFANRTAKSAHVRARFPYLRDSVDTVPMKMLLEHHGAFCGTNRSQCEAIGPEDEATDVHHNGMHLDQRVSPILRNLYVEHSKNIVDSFLCDQTLLLGRDTSRSFHRQFSVHPGL